MYMIQGGQSEFPRSAAAVAALYSAGIYKGPEITKGLDYLMQFMPNGGATRHESYYFYGQYYAAQAMWQAGGRDSAAGIRPSATNWLAGSTKTAPGGSGGK